MKVSLSSRELEILRKSADGWSAEQIADELQENHKFISRSQKDLLARTGQASPIGALQELARRGFVLTDAR